MKKIVALLMMVAMLLSSFAVCGAIAETSIGANLLENGRYEKIVLAIDSDPADLLPARPMGIKSYFFWNVYETLFNYDDNMNFVPNLATGYTMVSDTEWHFKLFETIYDSDGNHITADDIVYSYNWVVESGNAIKYSMFDHIEKVDDYTVAIHWKSKPASMAALEFILARTFIFSQTAFEQYNFSSEPVATGNYTVSKYVSGSELVLEANDNYWALNTTEDVSMRMPVHNANVQTIVYKIIPESSQAVISLEMGTADFCDYVPSAMLGKFTEGGEYANQYHVVDCLTSDYYYLAPNMQSAIFADDLNLRLAIYYALDNPSIATAMGVNYTPMAFLGTSYYYDFNTDWEKEETYANSYNVALAKEYLSKSNYKGEKITIMGLSNESSKNGLTMIQAFLGQIGINAEIIALENTIMQATYAEPTGWDMMFTTIGGSSLVGSWSKLFDNKVNNGYTTCWLADDTLQERYLAAMADATHDDEHVKACIDYAFSIGAVYPVAGKSYSIVLTNDLIEIYFQESYATVGASTYAGQ